VSARVHYYSITFLSANWENETALQSSWYQCYSSEARMPHPSKSTQTNKYTHLRERNEISKLSTSLSESKRFYTHHEWEVKCRARELYTSEYKTLGYNTKEVLILTILIPAWLCWHTRHSKQVAHIFDDLLKVRFWKAAWYS
jgi:hypothetical protein